MNVSLTPELEQFVSTKVDFGRYNSASEVVREALRLLEEHDQARSSQLAAFNEELGRRLASLDRGEHVDPAAVRERIESRSRGPETYRGISRIVAVTQGARDIPTFLGRPMIQ